FCTAGASYISPSIVGQIRRGQRTAKAVEVSISSERPPEILPSVLAVHGAITNKSAQLAQEICRVQLSDDSSPVNIWVATECLDREAKVFAPTNCCADRVIVTRTSAPSFW